MKGINCEDLDHMISTLLTASTFDCCDSPHYYYRCFVGGSVSSSRYDRLFFSLLIIFDKWNNLSCNKYMKQSDFIQKLLAFEYPPLLWYYHALDKPNKKAYKKEMVKYSSVMAVSKDKRVIMVNIALKLFGLRAASTMMNYYYTYKFGAKK